MTPRAVKLDRVRRKVVGALVTSLIVSLVPGFPPVPGLPVQFALAAGTTARLSTSLSGGEANGGSAFTSVSADGRYVAFASFANNLVTGDTTGGILLAFVPIQAALACGTASIASSPQEAHAYCSYASAEMIAALCPSPARIVSVCANLFAQTVRLITQVVLHVCSPLAGLVVKGHLKAAQAAPTLQQSMSCALRRTV